jgi:maltooligosyltrehalose trehalohydrolase
LLFMGEEYGEQAPFLFVTDFQDEALRAAVTRGRREEFAAFGWTGDVPDPQDPASFARSKLNWSLQEREPHSCVWEYYRTLLELRRKYPALGTGNKGQLAARVQDKRLLVVLRQARGAATAVALLNFSPEDHATGLSLPRGQWCRLVDSGEARFGGPGAKTPPLLDVARGREVQVDMCPFGAAIFLRTQWRNSTTGQIVPALPCREDDGALNNPDEEVSEGTDGERKE